MHRVAIAHCIQQSFCLVPQSNMQHYEYHAKHRCKTQAAAQLFSLTCASGLMLLCKAGLVMEDMPDLLVHSRYLGLGFRV